MFLSAMASQGHLDFAIFLPNLRWAQRCRIDNTLYKIYVIKLEACTAGGGFKSLTLVFN